MTRVPCVLLAMLFVLLSLGCASDGGEVIRIDGRHVVARQNMTEELSMMLRGLGYDWVPIIDPINQQKVKTVVRGNEHRMLFEHQSSGQVRVDVRITWENGRTRLHFYEPGSKSLSTSSRELLQQLRQRTARQFGEANVTY